MFAQEVGVALVVVGVGLVGEMDLTVQLDGELQGGAIEIEDIGADTELAAEFEAVHLPAFQDLPQGDFGRGHSVSEVPAEAFILREVV